MRKRIYRVEMLLLSGVLGFLGFSCSDQFGETPDMYGTPVTHFIIKGAVTDESGKPIKGIRVITSYRHQYNENAFTDTLYTNEKGQFENVKQYFPSVPDEIETEFTDMDGEQNGGSFKSEVQEKTKSDFVQTKKGKGFFSGEFTLTIKQILKKIK